MSAATACHPPSSAAAPDSAELVMRPTPRAGLIADLGEVGKAGRSQCHSQGYRWEYEWPQGFGVAAPRRPRGSLAGAPAVHAGAPTGSMHVGIMCWAQLGQA